MLSLRHYQHRALELLDTVVAAGLHALLLVLPTGAGKTVVAAELIRRTVARGERALFLAPRRELVTQASRQLARIGVAHGLLLAGCEDRQDLFARVQVASLDTLQSRLVRRKRIALPSFELVIVDEAHLSITAARTALLSHWPDALRVGLTATPTRKDGRALGLVYQQIIEPTTVADLTREGFLVPARYLSVSEPDLQRVRVVAGDYHAGELEAAVNQPKLVGDIVAHSLRHAADRRTVVFASSIAHSVALATEFTRAGVAAEHVDAGTEQAMRDEIFERFRTGRTQVLCNCFLASYGFDLPELSCVVLARPTRSLMLYLQMVGRGLRPADGKSDCLVLDHSGCVHRHGFAADPRAWTLDGAMALTTPVQTARKPNELKMIDCPECAAVFAGSRVCPECGYCLTPVGKQIVTLDGELIEIGAHLPPEEQDRLQWYAELLGIAAERRHKPGWAAYSFREKFGHWPPNEFRLTPPAMPSTTTRRWEQSRRIAYFKSREQRRA
jgi:superfamily II DNA or RNA helicase